MHRYRTAFRVVAAILFIAGVIGLWKFRDPLTRYSEGELDRIYHVSMIHSVAEKTGIDPIFLMAVVYVESRFVENAKSSKGALGLMQVMPSTAEYVAMKHGLPKPDHEDLHTPEKNLLIGALYLKDLLEQFGDTDLAVAAYNGGPTAVEEWLKAEKTRTGGTADLSRFPKKETRQYVASVREIHARLRRFIILRGWLNAWRF